MRLLHIATVSLVLSTAASPLFAGHVNDKGELGLFTLRSGYTYDKGQWGFSLYGNEWDWRVASDKFWENFDPLWSNWDMRHRRASLGIGFGLSDRVELDLSVPYEWYKAGHVVGPNMSVGHLFGNTYNTGEIDLEGLGDVRVGLAFGLVDTDSSGLALRLFADAPTGDDDEGVVTGELGYGLGLAWTAGNWVINGAYHDLGDPDILSVVKMRPGLIEQEVSPRVELGLGYDQPFGDRWEWITELSGDVMTESTGEYDRANLASGGRVHFGNEDRWAFSFGARIDVAESDFDSSALGGLIGLSYNGGPLGVGPSGRSEDRQPSPPPPPVAPPPPPAVAPPPPPAAPTTHPQTVRSEGTGNGVVTSAPPGIDCGSDCRETYAPGTGVRLTGKPDACSTFGGFGGDCTSDGSVTMSSDRTCTARFDSKAAPTPTFAACDKYGAWDCQSGVRETVTFAPGTATLAENAATSDGRGVLCDWANQLRACPNLRLCIAGSSAASEDACFADQRSDVLVEFFRRQSNEGPFSGIASRVQAAPSCSPDDEKGSVGNLLFR